MLFWLAVVVIIDEIVLWRRSLRVSPPARVARRRRRPTTLTIDLTNRW
jgi:hypothetical protein